MMDKTSKETYTKLNKDYVEEEKILKIIVKRASDGEILANKPVWGASE